MGMEKLNDNLEIQGDLREEYEAILNAEEGEEVELVNEEEIKELVRDLWEELASQEEYTEEDAFRDFIAEQQEDWN